MLPSALVTLRRSAAEACSSRASTCCLETNTRSAMPRSLAQNVASSGTFSTKPIWLNTTRSKYLASALLYWYRKTIKSRMGDLLESVT